MHHLSPLTSHRSICQLTSQFTMEQDPLQLSIRPYKPEYKSECMAAFHSNVPTYFVQKEIDDFSKWLDAAEHEHYYVGDINGQIVACGGFHLDHKTNEARMTWGLVHRHYHRQGLGKQMILFRISTIKTLAPHMPIALDTTQHAAAFFEKMGFKTHKITKDFYAPGMDRYDMELESD